MSIFKADIGKTSKEKSVFLLDIVQKGRGESKSFEVVLFSPIFPSFGH